MFSRRGALFHQHIQSHTLPFRIQLLLLTWMPLPFLVRPPSSLLSKPTLIPSKHASDPFPTRNLNFFSSRKQRSKQVPHEIQPEHGSAHTVQAISPCQEEEMACIDINPANAWTITKTLTGTHCNAAHSRTPAPSLASAQNTAANLTAQFQFISNDPSLGSVEHHKFTAELDGPIEAQEAALSSLTALMTSSRKPSSNPMSVLQPTRCYHIQVLLFQAHINDLPLEKQDRLFMDYC